MTPQVSAAALDRPSSVMTLGVQAERGIWRRAPVLLLVLAALLPRAAMAWKRDVLSPDAVFYIERAQAFGRGDTAAAFADLKLNLYPVVLSWIGRLSGNYETAGRWSLAMASLVVLPIYGLARRMANERVAIAAALLYAFYPESIEWSPEIIRDPTFWFLMVTALYLSWRAVASAQILWHMLAGLAISAAILIRFEGWFLWFPLGLWSLGLLGRDVSQALWPRITRLLAAVGVFPVVLVLANISLLPAQQWQFGRLDHLKLAQSWFSGTVIDGSPVESFRGSSVPHGSTGDPAPLTFRAAFWGFRHTVLRGLGPLYVSLALVGFWHARNEGRWRHRLPLDLLTLLILAAIWVYLCTIHDISKRYVIPVMLLAVFDAAWGIELLSRAVAWRGAQVGRPQLGRSCAAALITIVAAIGMGDAFSSTYDSREMKATLGRWIRAEYGSSRRIVSSYNLDRLVGYYARAVHHDLPPGTAGDDVVERIRRERPELIALWMDVAGQRGYTQLLAERESLGFVAVETGRLPSGCEGVLLLARKDLVSLRGVTSGTAERLARESSSTRR